MLITQERYSNWGAMNFRLWLNAKRGTLLISDVVFLVLAVAFITILIVFITKQSSETHVLEEKAAKQLALMIDAAESGTKILWNVGSLIEHKEEGFTGEVIRIDGQAHAVTVQLEEKSGVSYGYFTDVQPKITLHEDYLEVIIP